MVQGRVGSTKTSASSSPWIGDRKIGKRGGAATRTGLVSLYFQAISIENRALVGTHPAEFRFSAVTIL